MWTAHKLKNVITNEEQIARFQTLDKLQPTLCSEKVCMGAKMFPPLHSANTPRSKEEVLKFAKDFLDQYYTSIRRNDSADHVTRWTQVQEEVNLNGVYQLTETELVFGVKLAWRNAARCIGRIQWSNLQVFDCRSVTTTSDMFEALCNHIKYGTNNGNIRSAITVFPQRTDGRHDYKVWNPQLIAYAGHKQPDGSIVGDPMNVEFTEVCKKLGWQSKGSRFDVLPLVLSANGQDPDYFDIPAELILEVPLTHPTYEWFEQLDLRWFALPAVSGMLFDCGGLQFPAAPFNGWYMSTEIGCRNLCDAHRYNILETVAVRMGLDTRTPVTLWKDKAMVEVNLAVLHSFTSRNVTIVDHHTASETFMKHHENESRLRNGCPADWVWIVPPMSGSATPVFHQEMAMYLLKPSYDYQVASWKSHQWKNGQDADESKKPRRKFHFKQIARAVMFASMLYGSALSRRIKVTVLYATETGKSENYAKKLADIFGHAFNAKVYCMSDYDMSSIEHEALLLFVASTFGNGDPPENGKVFAQSLHKMKMVVGNELDQTLSLVGSESFIQDNRETEPADDQKGTMERFDSLRESVNNVKSKERGQLSNVRFAVFALGSSAYPNFCAFGKYVDNLLGELGGERLMKMSTGDEMGGQEQAFRKWAPVVFSVACETFCLEDDDTFLEATQSLHTPTLSNSTVRFVEAKQGPMAAALSKCYYKKVSEGRVLRKTNLHNAKKATTRPEPTVVVCDDTEKECSFLCCTLPKFGKKTVIENHILHKTDLQDSEDAKTTIMLEFKSDLSYQPGDHVGVFACNRRAIVDGVLERLQTSIGPDTPVELQFHKENRTPNGVVKTWEAHERLSPCSLRTLLTRFLDLTTPPKPDLLHHFASIAADEDDKQRLTVLATDSAAYEDWRHWRVPHLLDVLEEFPSVRPTAALLVAQLTPLQPRFYSISSSPVVHPGQIHVTVAVVSYRTQDGEGPLHYGVCSNYLLNLEENEDVLLFVRSAPNFHLPSDSTRPVILVGPGTGIAPFRGFWQHRKQMLTSDDARNKLGKMWLFFGCRQKELDLYAEEKEKLKVEGVLDQVFLALSREKNLKKMYVQDHIRKESAAVYQKMVEEGGHFYVCGDCTMAEHVFQTLRQIIQEHGNMSDTEVETFMLKLRDENRYHEDIFGITSRTAKFHNSSRESARQG